jgi:hypothetical protein
MRYIYIFTIAVLLGQAAPVSAQAVADLVALVDSWYRMFLGRSALRDPAGAGWINLLRRGGSPGSVLAGILASPEYFNRVDGTMPAFIRAVYTQAVGRAPTPGELRFWLRRANIQSRQDIANDILAQHPAAGMVVTLPGVVAPPVVTGPGWPHNFDYRRANFPFRW